MPNEILLLNFFFSCINAIACVILVNILYEIRSGTKQTLSFIVLYGLISSLVDYFIKQMGEGLNIAKTIIIFIFAVLLLKAILKLDFKRSLISFGLSAIIFAVSDSLVLLTFKVLNIDTITILKFSNFVYTFIANLLLNAFAFLIIGIMKFFKLYKSISFNVKATITTVLITFFSILITMSYYYFTVKNNLNIGIFIVIVALMVFYSIFMITSINTSYKLGVKQKELEQQKFYNEALDKSLDNLRRFRHGYNNNLSILYMHAKLGNFEKMMNYFNEMLELNNKLNDTTALYIKNAGLFGIISSKISYAEEKGVKFKIDPNSNAGEVENIKVTELCEIVGVFLDNAIEAASESTEKAVYINITDAKEALGITVKNSYLNEPDLKKIFEKGYSSKGEGRGLGLWIVKNIVKNNKHILHNTYIEDKMFIQELVIDKGL